MRDKHLGYWFLAPATITLVAVLVFPAVITVLYSITAERAPLLSRLTLRNYELVASDEIVWTSFVNTILFVTCSVGFHLLMGLWVALLLHETVKGGMVFQTIMLLPWTIPDVVAGIIWKWMLHPINGIVNDLLFSAGMVDTTIEWLSRPALAFPSVIATNIWRGFPFIMVILLAGLKSIPVEQYEAAAVDGATALQRFRYITIPGLRKLIVIAVALDTVWEFRRFGLVATMTNGGPGNSTEILALTVFKQYFEFFRFEFASAVAIVMSLLLLVVSIPYIVMMVREEA